MLQSCREPAAVDNPVATSRCQSSSAGTVVRELDGSTRKHWPDPQERVKLDQFAWTW